MKKLLLCLTLLMSMASFAQTVSCPALQVSGDDGNGYLEVTQSTCTFTTITGTVGSYSTSYTLTHPITVNIVDGYHDATSGISVIHTYLEITTPAGKVNKFVLYEDRNSGGPNISSQTWPGRSLSLPAGTVIEYDVQVFTHTLTDCASGCALNADYHLNSDL